MIEFTVSGITIWLLGRKSLIDFYLVLGIFLLWQNTKIFKNPIKNLIYSFSFISLVVGMWELPLFWFTLPYGWIWTVQLILYAVPFLLINLIFKIKYVFTKKELTVFLLWCFISVISFIICYSIWYKPHFGGYIGFSVFNHDPSMLWDFGLSYVFRLITFISLFKIFRNVK